ncbi:hypothetical protein TRIUR3_28038 [Triticum urartu]|uniref:Uncharacterized protein n=1 Tax=Triticum urartu TaxID=4572 RepID=M7YK62_TRIUA|nr:hypothetical protein TRIUR3_28038 [Triticum urartu]
MATAGVVRPQLLSAGAASTPTATPPPPPPPPHHLLSSYPVSCDADIGKYAAGAVHWSSPQRLSCPLLRFSRPAAHHVSLLPLAHLLRGPRRQPWMPYFFLHMYITCLKKKMTSTSPWLGEQKEGQSNSVANFTNNIVYKEVLNVQSKKRG